MRATEPFSIMICILFAWSMPMVTAVDTEGRIYDICSSNKVSGSYGHIIAETFPVHAQQGNDCEIRIDVPFHSKLTLTFNDFSIATNDSSKLSLEVIWLSDNSFRRSYSGHHSSDVPIKLNSLTPVILRLKAIDFVYQLVFSVHFQIKTVSADNPPALRNTSLEQSARDICGNSTNDWGTSGYIKSPSYPKDYGKNLNCSVTIVVPTGKKLILAGIDFRTSVCDPPSLDFVKIVSNSSFSQEDILSGDYSEDVPFKTEYKAGDLTITFISDAEFVNKGFLIFYQIVQDVNPCENYGWGPYP